MAARQSLRTWCEQHHYPYVMAVACNEPLGIVTPDGRRRWVEVGEVEGTKGPRLFDWACVPMLHQWEEDGRHWLLMRRSLTDPREKAYYFVFGPPGTTLQEMVKAIGARWHIEEVFQTAKDLGLDQDAGAQLRWMVSPYHVGDADACVLSRDLCPEHPLDLASPCRRSSGDS